MHLCAVYKIINSDCKKHKETESDGMKKDISCNGDEKEVGKQYSYKTT